MKLTNKQIKQIIKEELRKALKEVDRDSCAVHSLGFIDLEGNFIDLESFATEYQKRINVAYTHGDYLESVGLDWTPDGWIKVSNAYLMTIEAPDWSAIKPQQVDGLIEMWMSCTKYSPWIRKKANSKPLEFWAGGEVLPEMTLEKFLLTYGTKEQFKRFFNFLINY